MIDAASRFFLDTALGDLCIQGSHEPGLVLLSVLVSIFSATMALQIAQIARRTENALYRHVAIGTGTVALGGGIWSMHFIGMLAFELPTHMRYDFALTAVSLLPACVASWLALRLLAQPRVKRPQLAMSGALVGLGIGAMHYTGMAALQTSLQMRYDPVLFVLSIVVAVGLATLALWIRYGLRRVALGRGQKFIASGVIMGLAIAGMHYTGMAAVRFIGTPGVVDNGLLVNNTAASLMLSFFTVTVTMLVASLNNLIRSRELYNNVQGSKSRLRATLDTAVDGIITIDKRGLIQGFNQSAERLFGWTAEEVTGRNIKMLMPEPDQSRHDDYLGNYHSTGIPKVIGIGREVMGLRKDGRLMPMRLAVGRVELPGELLFVGFVTDTSERHALEASLRETAERAELAAAAKSIFLANMSHEIRTPMNSIIGFTELLLQSDLTTVQYSQLNTIRQASRSLLGLINDILDTTRMEKGRLELEVIDFSLKGLALQVESALRLGAHAKNLALTTYYPAEMPEHFRGDPLRVLQVLNNLVGNAIKFTEKGRVDIYFSHEADTVHVRVLDTGIGMTPEQVASIFTAFTQADASISRRFGGTGLGTTIARQLVDLMGGSIDVESELRRGSTFHLRLPLPVGHPPPKIPLEAVPTLPPLNVLIVDDVPQNLELLTLTLEHQGHLSVPALDGQEALEKYIAGKFDVVLMDVHMPGTDGLQATRLIRQYERSEQRKPTPVIALTASVLEEDRRFALQAGMNGFAAKPLDVVQLFQEIAKVLNQPPSPASSHGAESDQTSASLIDWQFGTALWGSRERLIQAVIQFLRAKPTKYPLPRAQEIEIDWEKAMSSLHGIRGAAGNLALPEVARMAGELETLLRQGGREQVLQRVAELRALLAAVQQELSQVQLKAGDTELETLPEQGTPADGLRFMLDLQAVVERNEFDAVLLDNVCAGLLASGRQQSAQALRTAMESFEFQRALSLLRDEIVTHVHEV